MICGEKRAKKQRSRQRSGIFEWLLFISPPRSGSKIEGRGTKVRFCQIRAWAGFDRRQAAAAAAAKSLQSCPTLCDHRRQPTRLPHPWDSPGKNTGVGCHFLLQCVKVKSLGLVRLVLTPWTAAHQAPPSMGFSRQEYWSGVLLSSPRKNEETAPKQKQHPVVDMTGDERKVPCCKEQFT